MIVAVATNNNEMTKTIKCWLCLEFGKSWNIVVSNKASMYVHQQQGKLPPAVSQHSRQYILHLKKS